MKLESGKRALERLTERLGSSLGSGLKLLARCGVFVAP